MTWVNFAEIRARVSLEDVLFTYYSLPHLTREGDKVVGPCPIHNGEGPRSFSASISKRVWHCFACGKGGNQLDFVAAKEGITVREAALRLQVRFLANGHGAFLDPPSVTPPASRQEAQTASALPPRQPATTVAAVAPVTPAAPVPPPEPKRNPPLELRLALNGDHPHLVERKLARSTVSTFGVGSCGSGILRGQIAIPIHDQDGVLVAYAGRRLKEEDITKHGKYKFPKGFVRDMVVYNLHRARASQSERGLVVVEGFFTTMRLHELGFPNTVATMGVEVSAHQVALLAKAPRVFVLFDGDDAGRRGGAELAARLTGHTTVHLIEIPRGKEPEDLEPKALRWVMNGARELGLSRVSFDSTT